MLTLPFQLAIVTNMEIVPDGGMKKSMHRRGIPHQVMANCGPGTLLIDREAVFVSGVKMSLASILGNHPNKLKRLTDVLASTMSEGSRVAVCRYCNVSCDVI